MVKSRTLVSFIAELSKEFRNDHMKLCFLWYDEIMLEGIMNDYRRENYAYQILEGEKISKKQFQIFTDVVVPLQHRISGDLLQDHEL